jgi:fructose-bisphosphate aldolase class I
MLAYNGKYAEELMATFKYLATPRKGLLAVDENTGTIGKQLANFNVENVEYNRQALGELLFTAPDVAQCFNGVIQFEETLSTSTPIANLWTQTSSGLEVLPLHNIQKLVPNHDHSHPNHNHIQYTLQ